MRITAIATLVFSTFMSVAIADDAARATAEKVVEMKDGREVIMIGNQVAYLERLINRGHRGGGGR